ncbi:acyltransferase domain-containing protein, partial [Streptomyces sp. NRRL B-24572]|uniref:acyltransferase domain-containing protein n=1 Tax=Streptomyces sp. NRRL B-24572 TaxID=1962156 RepID=UPI0015C50D0D
MPGDELLGRLGVDAEERGASGAHGPAHEFAAAAPGIRPRATTAALVSTVTGEVVEGPALDHAYWADNLRRPVRFVQAVDTLVDLGCRTFVEVGAHPTLSPRSPSAARHGASTPSSC